MATPTQADINKYKGKLVEHENKLDDEGRIKERYAVSQLRSAIRQVWMRAPNKLAVLERARTPDMDPATRTKWLYQCAICKNMFKQADVEVDHIEGNHTFTEIADFQNYWDKVLNVSTDGLQVLCKDNCHAIKTYQEANGLTWEEASRRKKVIDKLKQDTNKQKKELMLFGYTAFQASNKEKRDKCYTELLDKGRI